MGGQCSLGAGCLAQGVCYCEIKRQADHYPSNVYQKTADNMKPAAVKTPPTIARPH